MRAVKRFLSILMVAVLLLSCLPVSLSEEAAESVVVAAEEPARSEAPKSEPAKEEKKEEKKEEAPKPAAAPEKEEKREETPEVKAQDEPKQEEPSEKKEEKKEEKPSSDEAPAEEKAPAEESAPAGEAEPAEEQKPAAEEVESTGEQQPAEGETEEAAEGEEEPTEGGEPQETPEDPAGQDAEPIAEEPVVQAQDDPETETTPVEVTGKIELSGLREGNGKFIYYGDATPTYKLSLNDGTLSTTEVGIVLELYAEDNTLLTGEAAAQLDKGTYEVRANTDGVDENKYHVGSIDKVIFKVNPVKVKVEFSDSPLTMSYGDEPDISLDDLKITYTPVDVNEKVKLTADQLALTYLDNGKHKAVSSTTPADDYTVYMYWKGGKNAQNPKNNYSLQKSGNSYPSADLTIEKKHVKITITGTTDTSVVYTGSEQEVDVDYDVSSEDVPDITKDDVTYSESAPASVTVKGVDQNPYPMGLKPEYFAYESNNFIAEADDFEVTDGTVTVTQANLVIKIVGNQATGENAKTYNGKGKSISGYTATLVSGDESLFNAENVKITGKAEAKGTDADTYPMGLKEEQFSYSDPNVKVDWQIEDGKLEIKPAEMKISIKGETLTSVYDGTEQEKDVAYVATPVSNKKAFDASKVKYPKEESESEKAKVKGTNADTYPMNLDEAQFYYDDPNYTGVFTVSKDGSFVIEKAPITITVTGDTLGVDEVFYYDAMVHEVTYSLSCESELYKEENVVYNGEKSSVTRTAAGTVSLGLKKKNFDYSDDNIKAEFVIAQDAKIVITPFPIEIKVTDQTVTYDGKPHASNAYEIVTENVPGDPKFTLTMDNTGFTDVKRDPETNEVLPYENKAVSIGGKNGTTVKNYAITIEDGTITIEPFETTLTVTEAAMVYDAQDHVSTEYTVDPALPVAHTFELTMEREDFRDVKRDDANSVIPYDNNVKSIDGIEVSSGQASAGNYLVNVKNGNLTIEPCEVVLTVTDVQVTYNGVNQTSSAYTASGLPDGDNHKFTLAMDDTPHIDAAEYENIVKSVDGVTVSDVTTTIDGEETTERKASAGNYAVTVQDGKITINPCPISISSFNQVQGGEPHKFALKVDFGNELKAIQDGDIISSCVSSATGATESSVMPDTTGNWSGTLFTGERSDTTLNLTLTLSANFTPASLEASTVAKFAAKGGSLTFANRDKEVKITSNDAEMNGLKMTVSGNGDYSSSSTASSQSIAVTWDGNSLIHSGTKITVTYQDEYANEATIEGSATRSSVSASTTLKTDPRVTYNSRNNVITVGGEACAYETVVLKVTGPNGFSLTESKVMPGDGDYSTDKSSNYNWQVKPRDDGEYQVTISYDDVNGPKATSEVITVDTVLTPLAISLRPFDACDYAILAGVTEPESTVELKMSDRTLGKTSVDNFGYFSICAKVPNEEKDDTFDGYVKSENDFVVVITDAHGNRTSIRYDKFEHSQEDYPVQLSTPGRWVVAEPKQFDRHEKDGESPWAMATPLREGAQDLPLLLGAMYQVGTLHVEKNGASILVSYELDEELDEESYSYLKESFQLYDHVPSISEVERGSDSRIDLMAGQAVTLPQGFAGEMLYLVADIDMVLEDIDGSLYEKFDEPPFDLSRDANYTSAN